MKGKVLLGITPNTDLSLISGSVWDYWHSKYVVTFTPTKRKGRYVKKIWGTPHA